MAACDLAVIFACFVAGRAMNYLVSGMPWHATWYHWRIHYGDTRLVIFVALGLACVFAFWRLGHYARRRPFWQELGDVLGVVLTLAILDAALVFLTKTNFSRLWWATSWGLVALLVPLVRLAIKHVLMALGAWRRSTVVVGIGPNALDAALALESEALLGFEVVAFIAPPGAPPAPLGAAGRARRRPTSRSRASACRCCARHPIPTSCRAISAGRMWWWRSSSTSSPAAAPTSSASTCTTATSTSSRRCAACRSPARG